MRYIYISIVTGRQKQPLERYQSGGSLRATRQNPTKKVLGERLRKSRTAARFAASHPAKLRTRTKKVLGERLRRSRTAARFAPLPCEAATTKTQDSCPSTAKPQPKKKLSKRWGGPTERIRKNEPPGKTQPKRCLGSAFEKAEQQQDSPASPTPSQNQNQPNRCLRSAFEKAEQQQDSRPCTAKPQPKKPLETLPTERIRKKEPPGKTQPKRCLGSAFEKAETAARFAASHPAKPNQTGA